MEAVLKNGFNEMNQDEIMETDGGNFMYYSKILVVRIITTIIKEDLKNCYKNAYNEVYYSYTEK